MAFDCAGTGFSVTFANGLTVAEAVALAPVLRGVLATAFVSALFKIFSVAPFGAATFALPDGLVATAVFVSGFAVVLDAADFAVFVGGVWVFAGFFIAFAMESTTN
ncbi:MAG: hypothetical protein P4L91_18345 [Burkholderiaceae bacterium]|nr:hypothetical protein [Burkholderiaceae bacterium]